MSLITGKFQHYKNEDIDDYFIAVGVPYLGRKMMSMSSPVMEISVNDDTYTIKNTSMVRTVISSFKLGEEYDETMPNATIKSVTTIDGEDEMVTKSVIPEKNEKCQRHYKFTQDECVVTLTHEKAAKPGKRYFRRIK